MKNRNKLMVFIATGLLLTGCDNRAYPGYDETGGTATYVTNDHYVQAPPPRVQPAGPQYGPSPANRPGGPSYGPPAPGGQGGGPAYGPQGPDRSGPSYGY
jgi:hypothetical protein